MDPGEKHIKVSRSNFKRQADLERLSLNCICIFNSICKIKRAHGKMRRHSLSERKITLPSIAQGKLIEIIERRTTEAGKKQGPAVGEMNRKQLSLARDSSRS